MKYIHQVLATLALFLLLAFTAIAPVHAGTLSKDPEGLYIDETFSYGGYEFFQAFSEAMSMGAAIHFSSLVVKELPHVTLGNMIDIEVDHESVFQTKIYRGSRHIARLGKRAAAVARIRSRQLRNVAAKNPDLAAYELQGL